MGTYERVPKEVYHAGFAAANTEVRELRTVVIPALAIEMVCCSIASWIATLNQNSYFST